MTVVNGCQPLTNVRMNYILDVTNDVESNFKTMNGSENLFSVR